MHWSLNQVHTSFPGPYEVIKDFCVDVNVDVNLDKAVYIQENMYYSVGFS